MNPFKSIHGIATVLSALALVAIVVGIYIAENNQPTQVAAAKLEVGKDDKTYCANLIANKFGRDAMEVTISNCGETSIALKSKNGSKSKVLAAGKQYETVLLRDSRFSVTIESVDGEYLGDLAII